MYTMSRFIALAAFALLAGCTDSTGATDGALTGRWSYSAPSLTSGSLRCAMTGVTLSLNQNGSSFSGNTSGGTITCAGQSESLGSTVVHSGVVSGDQVTFIIGEGDNLRHTGTVSGNTIAGAVTASGTSGTFTMTRQ